MFQLEQIDHAAITVSNLERSITWYRDVLGLERRYAEVWGDYPVMMCAGLTGVALFPASTDYPQPRPMDDRTTIMLRHLAFRVNRANFERAHVDLRARGIPFEFQDHTVSHSIYFHDPDGYEIEITTYEL